MEPLNLKAQKPKTIPPKSTISRDEADDIESIPRGTTEDRGEVADEQLYTSTAPTHVTISSKDTDDVLAINVESNVERDSNSNGECNKKSKISRGRPLRRCEIQDCLNCNVSTVANVETVLI